MREIVGKKSRTSYTPNEDLCATIDTGCQRMAIGLNTLKRFDQALPSGLQTSIVPQEHRFRSVHGTSTTKYVAAIPTSLGQRGSLLRPAVFETNASRDAPFLISLPFLMFCHAVLYLDPRAELKVEFRKFKFSAPCHIGPTGSLRVSLADFSADHIKRLQKAQEEFQQGSEEFENFRLSSVFGPEQTKSEPNPNESNLSVSHGVPRSDEESPNRCGGSRTGLETDGAEAALSGLPHHGLGPSDPDAEEAGPDATVLGVANGGHPGGEGGQRHGEPGRLLDGEIREGGSNAPVTDPQLCFASHRGSQLCDGRGPRVDGSTTNMLCPSSSLHPIHDEETRPKLRTDVLAMSHGSRSAVPLLRMDTGAAQLEGTNGELGQFHRQPSDSNIAEVYGTEDTRTCTAGRVHPLSHDQSRDECRCPTGEVRDLRQGAEERGQEGIGHGVCSIQQVAGFQGVQEEGADQGAPEDDTRGDRRVRGVPELLE